MQMESFVMYAGEHRLSGTLLLCFDLKSSSL